MNVTDTDEFKKLSSEILLAMIGSPEFKHGYGNKKRAYAARVMAFEILTGDFNERVPASSIP